MIKKKLFFAHTTAEISPTATIGKNTKIWNYAVVRDHAIIGKDCIIARGVSIDSHVKIGSNVKIQEFVAVYDGVTIEDGVFIGPQVVFTNDLYPRAISPDGTIKKATDWKISKTSIKKGASIGAGSVVVCGKKVGEWAMVGAGSVVTKNVPNHALVFGNPAIIRGYVCFCGKKLEKIVETKKRIKGFCNVCQKECGFTK